MGDDFQERNKPRRLPHTLRLNISEQLYYYVAMMVSAARGTMGCKRREGEAMALRIVRTRDKQLANGEVRAAIATALDKTGRALVLVPSFDVGLRLQRELADGEVPTLGVTVTTPNAWTDERWEVYGDGRHIVENETRVALMRLELDAAAGIELTKDESPLPTSPGMRRMLCSLAKDALPAIPRTSAGDLDVTAPLTQGLTPGERRACQIACNYGRRLASRNFVERSEVMSAFRMC